MPRSGCDPCCNPSELARSQGTYRQSVLLILCAILEEEENHNAGSALLPDIADVVTNQVAVPTGVSTLVLAANPTRKEKTILVNPSPGVTFWVMEGGPAVIGQGSPLYYGGYYAVISNGNINVIQTSTPLTLINTIEVS